MPTTRMAVPDILIGGFAEVGVFKLVKWVLSFEIWIEVPESSWKKTGPGRGSSLLVFGSVTLWTVGPPPPSAGPSCWQRLQWSPDSDCFLRQFSSACPWREQKLQRRRGLAGWRSTGLRRSAVMVDWRAVAIGMSRRSVNQSVAAESEFGRPAWQCY